MSKEELARQLKEMETQMSLWRQAHDEERNELNNTISKLEANFKEEGDVESRLARLELSLSQSLESKGLLRGTNSRYVSGESVTTMEGEQPEMTMVNVGGRAQAITLTFGDFDTKPTTLERFISVLLFYFLLRLKTFAPLSLHILLILYLFHINCKSSSLLSL